MLKALLTVVAIVLVYAVFEFVRVKSLIKVSGQLIARSQTYQQHPAGATYKILVIGDSTGVGTGTSDPKFSLAGRLGTDIPTADITNLSQNGLRAAGLLAIVQKLPAAHYDFILIHIGGNDITHFGDLDQATADTRQTLQILAAQATQIAVFSTGNLGEAKLFPWISRPIFGYRSRQLRDQFKAMTSQFNNVAYVDLFAQPQSLNTVGGYAGDGLHLDDAGYALWYSALKTVWTPSK